MVWRADVMGVQRWFRCPQVVRRWLKTFSGRYLDAGDDGAAPQLFQRPAVQPQQQAGVAPAAVPPAPPPPQPDAEEMEQMLEALTAMGFERAQAEQALAASGYRLEVAVGQLVG